MSESSATSVFAEVESVYDLTPLQESMLFERELTGDPGLYVLQTAIELSGALDARRLRDAVVQEIRAHTALRTSFVWEGLERAQQVVWSSVDVPWETQDWSGGLRATLKERWRDLLRDDRQRGFDLETPPLIRATLVRLEGTEHLLLLSSQHMVIDGWSIMLLVRGVFARYMGSQLPFRPSPFQEYVRWLRRQPSERDVWARELSGFTPRQLRLAPGRTPESGTSEINAVLDEVSTLALDEIARRHGYRTATLYQAAWALVLRLYTGAQRVAFGTVVSGRAPSIPGGELTVGPFIHTLPMVVGIDLDASLSEWLERVARAGEALTERTASLQEIGAAVGARATSLFDTTLTVENLSMDEAIRHSDLGALRVRGFRHHEQAVFPVEMVVFPGRRTRLVLRHRRDHLDARIAPRLLRSFRAMLLRLARLDASPRVRELVTLEDDERHEVVGRWNATREAFPVTARVDELIAAQARVRRDAPALVSGTGTLSYAALAERARRLAAVLAMHGVRPGDRVALAAGGPFDGVVGLLATGRLGACLVPLDARLPAPMQKVVLAGVGARLVVGDLSLDPSIRDVARCIEIGSRPADGARAPEWMGGADFVAIAIPTVSEAGTLQLFERTHRSLVASISWARRDYGLGADDVVRCTPRSLAGIGEIEQLFPLSSGATVVVAAADIPSPRRVSRSFLDPSSQLDVANDQETLTFIGRPRRLEGRTDARVTVLDGGADIGDCAFYGPLRSDELGQHVLGKPIANVRCYVVDAELEPVPVGVTGELLVAGETMARGLAGSPRETAARWVPEPFAWDLGQRALRTGRRARWLPDGRMELASDHDVDWAPFDHVDRDRRGAAMAWWKRWREAHPRVVPCEAPSRGDAGTTSVDLVPPEIDVGELCWLAAWCWWLARMNGEPDLVLEASFDGQRVPVAVSLGAATCTSELLGAVRAAVLLGSALRCARDDVACDLGGKLTALFAHGEEPREPAHAGLFVSRDAHARLTLPGTSRRRVEQVGRALTRLATSLAEQASTLAWRPLGEQLAEQREHWQEHLRGLSPLLELPLDRPRAKIASGACATVPVELGPDCGPRLAALARELDATPFVVTLAAWKLVLSRLARDADVVVGVPASALSSDEHPGALLTELVPVRTDLGGQTSFAELVSRVSRAAHGAAEHAGLSLSELTRAAGLTRDAGVSRLSQVTMDWDGALDGVCEPAELALAVRSAPDGVLDAEIAYDTATLDRASAARIARWLARVLDRALTAPFGRTSDLSLMDEPERRALLEWSRGARVAVPESSVHELVEAQARHAPDRIALVSAEGTLTYGELDALTNRLARRLRSLGVGTGGRVVLCLTPGLDYVSAALAVMKAGAAYVSLDPTLPSERLRFMAVDSRAAWAVVGEQAREALSGLACELLPFQRWRREAASCDDASLRAPVLPRDLAYVIYTSGTTGAPKGVELTHEGLSNLCAWYRQEYRVSPADRATQVAGVGFDAAVWELWPCLSAGASVHVLGAAITRDPEAVWAYLIGHEITLAFLPTPVAEVALRSTVMTRARALRALFTGGDRLHRQAVGSRSFDLVNVYGPTENTVVSTWACVRDEEREPTIGAPPANTSAFVLDEALDLAPLGVAGELCVGGAQVARGYAGRARLTAAAFVPDPYAPSPGARMYRTGDLARWRPSGEIEFLGRIDRQVKLRGLRVELGEIESVLEHSGELRQAAVTVQRGGEGRERLIAFVVPLRAGATIAGASLERHLAQRLPDHMVPRTWVVLEALPLTPNGKLDRRALPEPEWTPSSSYEAPSTPTEAALAEIWCALLGLERIGRRDSFFDLGGHSLLATRLVSHVRAKLGVELPLASVFERPTLSGLAEWLEESSSEAALPPIVARERNAPARASYAQERLWILDRLMPGRTAYHIPAVRRVLGTIDIDAFDAALAALIARHESLRTRFEEGTDALFQVIEPSVATPLELVDLRECPADERTAQVRRRVEAAVAQPFDLTRAPLLRARLVRTEDGEHVLAFVMHHIIGDGWSIGVLVRELSQLYAAAAEGRETTLTPIAVQYADYAEWQRSWLEGGELERQLGYWRQQLAGAPPLLDLPLDRPRPKVRSERGGSVPVELGAELSARVDRLAHELRATPFMVLLSAWQLLLSKYARTEDVVVGSPIAGRRSAELEGLIGFFVNTLALRTDLSGEPTFTELVGRVREVTLGAYAHQDVPFEKLVAELNVPRDTSLTPVFQVMFVLQNTPEGEATAVADLRLSPFEVGPLSEKFDLTLSLGEGEGGLVGELRYSADVFEGETVGRLARHFVKLLERAVARPHERVLNISLLEEAERSELLQRWNQTFVAVPNGCRVEELFEAHVAREPHAVAVVHEDQALTYEELDRKANQLARYLIKRIGVEPEDRVGLWTERSLDMVVCLMAVLKSGAAYVAIDPDCPLDRARIQLDDAGVKVVLGHESLVLALGDHDAYPVLSLERDSAKWAVCSSEPPRVHAGPSGLLYVTYTSGSTGRPKGVAVEHRQMINYVWGVAAQLSLPEGLSHATVSTLAADLGNTAIYGALCRGGALHVISTERVKDAARMSAYLAEHQVDCLKAVPPHMQALLASSARDADVLPRECLILGGEAFPWELAKRLSAAGGPRVFNHYGPSETTVGVATNALERAAASVHGATVPIGYPLPNSALYVLDENTEPVPYGVPGELYIAGAGLTRGYLGRARQTAEKFVPDPWSRDGGGRMYRSGDSVRRLADGAVEFLGRMDFQVKIRGHRVELGEVEAHVQALAGVAQCVAMVRQDERRGAYLAAYVVPRAGGRLLEAELSAALSNELPAHMVPTAWVLLESLPLTANKKVDRRALPEPLWRSAESYEAPSTPTESVLAELWQELLGVERVGRRDSFFDLGGHSLLATRLVSRVRARMRVELPLRDVFDAPELHRLARRLDDVEVGVALPDIPRCDRESPLRASYAQERLWFMEELTPGTAAYHVPEVRRIAGSFDAAALHRALASLIHRHESLRTRFESGTGVLRQIVEPRVEVPLEVVDVRAVPSNERSARVHQLVGEHLAEPFDLARAPLLRARLIRVADAEHLLVLVLHHIVSDGWSMGVLVRELDELHQAEQEARAPRLAPLPVQYTDFAEWQRSWLEGGELERQLAYWREQLRGIPPMLELPLDHPRPKMKGHRGGWVPIDLGLDLTARVDALARELGATPFMVLLAAWQLVLARYARTDDIVVGSPIAGRRSAALEALIGLFVNTLALRTRLDGDPSFAVLVGRVKEVTLGAYAHQDVPFERLVSDLSTARETSITPLFQVMFVLQNTPDILARNRGSVPITALDADVFREKFDLTLALNAGRSEGLSGTLSYDASLFEAATVESFASAYIELLSAVVRSPTARVSTHALGTDSDRAMLGTYNATHRALGASPCLHEAFEHQVDRAPQRVALLDDGTGRSLSYAELDAAANGVAAQLRAMGVGVESRVGVCLERSAELLIGLYGVLKAGGAFVPMDPTLPASRLEYMARDADVRTVLVHEASARVVSTPGFSMLRIEDCLPRAERVRSGVCPGNAAYVLYTSGSTGQPKGAVNTHGAVWNRLRWQHATIGLAAGETVLHKTPYSFDVSVWELFWALHEGARLVIARPEGHKDPAYLHSLMAREAVDVVHFVPSMLSAFLETASNAQPRAVVVSGEALSYELKERFHSRFSASILYNLYGPTEAAVDVSSWRCEAGDGRQPVPIGAPVWNTELHVMDAQLRPQVAGVPGELCIGGVQVSRGYHGRPGLTASRFVPDPTSELGGDRLYRTGDLARWARDGQLLYLGRLDFQVKLRGFRIELGEIEAVLESHPAVSQAVVVMRGERLVAYAETQRDVEHELRRLLGERLPAYMVPSALVLLEALPLLPNGKLDRRALPEPEIRPTHYEAPATHYETMLAEIWGPLLGRAQDEVSVTASIFEELGADSLMVARVAAQMSTRIGRRVPVVSFFERPTIRTLAAALAETLDENGAPGAETPSSRDDAATRAARRKRALRGSRMRRTKASDDDDER